MSWYYGVALNPGTDMVSQPVLVAEGISFVRLDGSTSAKQRAERLRSFHSHAPGEAGGLDVGGLGSELFYCCGISKSNVSQTQYTTS